MAHPYLLGSGGLLIIIGLLLYRWASRYDLKGLALDAAWQMAKNRDRLDVETELGKRLKELRSEESNAARARRIAGHATRHVMAQALNVAALVAWAAGAVLIGLALLWK
jgi:hypothetical protein